MVTRKLAGNGFPFYFGCLIVSSLVITVLLQVALAADGYFYRYCLFLFFFLHFHELVVPVEFEFGDWLIQNWNRWELVLVVVLTRVAAN